MSVFHIPSESNPFEFLPQETIRLILQYLPFFPDLIRLNIVNKKFHQIVSSDPFFTYFDLQRIAADVTPEKAISNLLKNFAQQLLWLDLSRAKFRNFSWQMIKDILVTCTNLQRFSIAEITRIGINPSQETPISLPEGASFPKLQVLHLGVFSTISLENSIQPIFSSCPNLHTFLCPTPYAKGVSVFGHEQPTIYQSLPQTPHPHLEVMDLSGWSMLTDALVSSFITSFPSLKVIYAVNCAVKPRDGTNGPAVIVTDLLSNRNIKKVETFKKHRQWITNTNPCSPNGKSLLHMLVAEGAELARYMIEELGADVNAHTYSQFNASLFSEDKIKPVKKPLNAWIPQYPADETYYKSDFSRNEVGLRNLMPGFTPLFEAIAAHSLEMISYLITRGANVNHKALDGTTPLMLACSTGDVAVVELLLKNGADVATINKDGWNVVHFFIEKCNTSELFEERKQLLEMLIQHNADLNVVDVHGHTPLSMAVGLLNTAAADYLYKHGAKWRANTNKDLPYYPPLQQAMYQGRNASEMIKFLLKRVDSTEVDSDGATPVLLACKFSWEHMLELLLADETARSAINVPGIHSYTSFVVDFVAKIKKDGAHSIGLHLRYHILTGFGNQSFGSGSVVHLANLSDSDDSDKETEVSQRDTAFSLFGASHSAPRTQDEPVQLQMLKMLLESGVDVNARNSDGATALLLCCNKYYAAKLLLQHGADPKLADKNGWSPLHAAAAAVSPKLVKLMLEKGCDANCKDNKGVTPLLALFRAALHSEKFLRVGGKRLWKVMNILTEKGADINACDSINGMSVMHLIAALPNFGCLRGFVEQYKLDVNARAMHNDTPLHVALSFMRWSNAQELIQLGAKVDAQNSFGETALHTFMRQIDTPGFSISYSKPSMEAKLLLLGTVREREVERNLAHYEYPTWYSPNDNWKSSAPNNSDHDKLTYDEVLSLLVDNLENPNISDLHGVTPLLLFASKMRIEPRPGISFKGELSAFKTLLARGADVNAADRQGNTLLHLLCFPTTGDAEKLAKTKLELLIEHGADVNKANKRGSTPLHAACMLVSLDLLQVFLEKTDVDLNAQDEDGNTAFHVLVQNFSRTLPNVAEPVKLMLARGANLNLQNKNKETVLHSFVQQDNPYLPLLLIPHKGLEVNIQDQFGMTPLHYTVENWIFRSPEWIAVVVELLRAGARIDIKNDKDNTPFSVLSEQAVACINSALNSAKYTEALHEMSQSSNNIAKPDNKNSRASIPTSIFTEIPAVDWNRPVSSVEGPRKVIRRKKR